MYMILDMAIEKDNVESYPKSQLAYIYIYIYDM